MCFLLYRFTYADDFEDRILRLPGDTQMLGDYPGSGERGRDFSGAAHVFILAL